MVRKRRKKSRFVADLVACNIPVSGRSGGEAHVVGNTIPSSGQTNQFESNLDLGDSLIIAADNTISRLQDLLIKNHIIENKYADSSDNLIPVKKETPEMMRIMTQRYNTENRQNLKVKIKQLSDAHKISMQDESELNEIHQAVDDLYTAHEIVGAENAYLKRLIQKQSLRCRLESLKIDPEKSNDVQYLQEKINNLAKEVSLLRQSENEIIKTGTGTGVGSGENAFSPENDFSNIQRILAERDALHKKCKHLEELSNMVNILEQKASEAEQLSGDLEDNLSQQNQYIKDMQQEMQDMQNYYENEIDKGKGNEEVLKVSNIIFISYQRKN